jgi:hypothetical protein
MANIVVFIPGYTHVAHKIYAAITFLLLDQALGEYDVETRVGQVHVESASKAPGQTYSFEALPKVVDALFGCCNHVCTNLSVVGAILQPPFPNTAAGPLTSTHNMTSSSPSIHVTTSGIAQWQAGGT